MILPSDSQCQLVMKELADEPCLTQFEADFIDSNRARTKFTDRQKEVVFELMQKYEF